VLAFILLKGGGEDKTPVALPTQSAATSGPPVTVSPSPPPPVTVSPSVTDTASFTAEEQELLAMIPDNHRSTCVRATDQTYPGGQVAKLFCTSDSGESVTYTLFRDAAPMNAAFDDQAGSYPSGSCSKKTNVQGTYTIDGVQAGRLLCYQAPSQSDPNVTESWILWTDDRVLVFAWVSRSDTDRQALYDWWAQKSGPVPP